MKRLALFALLVILLFSIAAPAALAQGGNPVQAAAQQYFGGGTKNIKAADLYANLNDGDASNDPFMVDIRAAADYANGHIPARDQHRRARCCSPPTTWPSCPRTSRSS